MGQLFILAADGILEGALRGALKGAIIGGVIGIGIWGFLQLQKRFMNKKDPPDEPPPSGERP